MDDAPRTLPRLGSLYWGEPPLTPTTPEPDFAVPAGTVTFLLTDVEGSTRAWEADNESTSVAMLRLERIVSGAIGAHSGVRPVEQGEGDSAVAAFAQASDALACALEIQRALVAEPLKVRIALHTGEAQRRDSGNYFGTAIHRAARLRSLAHGGQTLLSRATHDLVLDRLPHGVNLEDVGTHRLRDLGRPEHVYQLCHRDLPADFPPIQSLDAVPNNLAVQLTTFIGRERQMDDVRRLLDEGRLLTLTGSGGCGKTRLALQVAADVLEDHPDGVWQVELAPTGDERLVPGVVARACGVQEIPGRTITESLQSHLRDQRVLLVLDNCEHVVGACAALVHSLLHACPTVCVLATSQAPLGVDGEVTWRVPSLTLPADGAATRIEALDQYEAVRLFIDRAKRARPNFAVTDENAPAVAQICHRLEGIPLAIELAAARTRMMGPEHILQGLSDRYRLLTGGSRTAVPRQQTLEASVDWSHSLLSQDERALLRRLSVFAGSFTLDAAEAVASADPVGRYAVLDLLSSLVDKSLVLVDAGDRYRLLETVRIYGARRLAGAGEHDHTVGCHLAFYVDFAERAAPMLERHEGPEWLRRLDAEDANLVAALDRAVEEGRADEVLRLTGSLGWYWLLRARLSDGRRRAEVALGLGGGGTPLARWKTLYAFGATLAHLYESEAQERVGLEMLRIAENLGDGRLVALSWMLIGDARGWRNAPDARDAYETAIEGARACGDSAAIARCLMAAGQYDFFVGDVALSTARLRESVALAREVGDSWSLLLALGTLWWPELYTGDIEDAEATVAATIDVAHAVGDRGWEATFLAVLGLIAVMRGRLEAADALLGEARATEREHPQAWVTGVMLDGTLKLARGQAAAAAQDLAAGSKAMAGGSVGMYANYLSFLGQAQLVSGDVDAARASFETAVAVSSDPPLPIGLGPAFLGQALLARTEGDHARAESLAHKSLPAVVLGYRPLVPDALELLAALASAQESTVEAARLFGAAQAVRDHRHYARFPVYQDAYDADVASVRNLLGEDAFRAGWDEGASLGMEDAIAYAQRGRGERKRPSTGWSSLTPAETRIVPLVAEHLTNAEIGARLFMSPTTVKTHLQRIYAKVGVSSRAELATEALRRGLA